MATQQDPQWVAEQFVNKYYEVLHSHPHMLHRFYKEHSTSNIILMADENTPPQLATDLQAIQAAVDTTVAGARATTKHMDTQHSVNDGVLLHVSGVMTLLGQERSFEQTFFLATQENGYYVHNDLLRVYPALVPHAAAAASNGNYVKPPAAAVVVPGIPVVVAAPAPAQVAAPAAVVPQVVVEPAAAAAVAPALAASKAICAPPPVTGAVAIPQSPSPSPAPPASAPSPQPPSSWASKVAAAPATPQKAAVAPSAPSAYPQANGTVPPQFGLPQPVAPQEAASTLAQPAQPMPQQPPQPHHHHHAPLHCIQVRNLPTQHLETPMLETHFSRFGPLLKRPPAVVVHNLGREGKVAYIKYEDASSVEAALQATNMCILDRTVEIRRHEGPLPSYHRTGGGLTGSQGPSGGASGRGQGAGGPAPYARGPRGGAGGRGAPYGDGSGGRGPGGKDRPPRRAGSSTPPPPLGAAGPGTSGGGLRPGTAAQAPSGGGGGGGARGARGGSGNNGSNGPRREEAHAAAKE